MLSSNGKSKSPSNTCTVKLGHEGIACSTNYCSSWDSYQFMSLQDHCFDFAASIASEASNSIQQKCLTSRWVREIFNWRGPHYCNFKNSWDNVSADSLLIGVLEDVKTIYIATKFSLWVKQEERSCKLDFKELHHSMDFINSIEDWGV